MRRDALVVGINQYPFLKDTSTSPAKHLTTPAGDAEAIAQRLEADGNFRVQRLPKREIDGKIQVDPNPREPVTADELVDEITKLFLTEDGRDTALLFFAGHGLSKPLGQLKQTLLATSDANPQGKKWNGLLLRDLWEIVEQSQVKEQIIWLDSCYSGELLEFKNSNFPEGVTEYRRLIIAASHSSEVAYARLNGKHGVLSGALIEGLDPSKIPQGDWITDRTLADFVERELKTYYTQTKIPQIPLIRRPDQSIELILGKGEEQSSSVETDHETQDLRGYLSRLIEKYRWLKLQDLREAGSLRIELEKVYIALKAEPETEYELQQSSKLHETEVLDEAGVESTDVINPSKLEDLQARNIRLTYKPVKDEVKRARITEVHTFGDAFCQHHRIVVLGGPGSGKTTLGRWLTLQFAKAQALALDEKTQKNVTVLRSQIDPDIDSESDVIAALRPETTGTGTSRHVLAPMATQQ